MNIASCHLLISETIGFNLSVQQTYANYFLLNA
jgi:hypothetical protein